MDKLMAVICFGLIWAFGAMAADYTWTGAAGNGLWHDPANFTVGGAVPAAAPGSADTVTVPDATTVTFEYDVNDAAKKLSCETFAGVKRIIPGGTETVFDITVPEGATLPVACPIVYLASTAFSNIFGTLIKKGKGELDLNAYAAVKSGSNCFDYNINFDVRDGVLKFHQNKQNENYEYFGSLTVAESAVVFTPHNTKSLRKAYFYTLSGTGTLTNDCSSQCELSIRYQAEFAGRLTGNIYVFTLAPLYLTSTENTTIFASVTAAGNYDNGPGVPQYGSIGIMKFGHKAAGGVKEPSSIGYAEQVLSRDNGGALLYLGTGEETDKDLRVWQQTSAAAAILDAGAHGGLVWNGMLAPYSTGYSTYVHYMSRLVLTGSNTTDCVMNGKFLNYTARGTNFPMCVTKRGTGTWRINYNSASSMHSVWQVKDGTLAFDSLAPVGVNSALGYSDWLYQDLSGVNPTDDKRVDYAFLLGNGVGKTRATLDYVGTTNCISSGRLFAVNGTGVICNNGTGRLVLSDFVVMTNVTDSSLVLGGTNTLYNVADNLRDGASGKLSVVKEDAGTWRLGTNCAFTGSLDIKAGRVIVGQPLYEYYRWVLRATYYTATDDLKYRYIGFQHFGLYDADGNLRTDQMDHTGDWYETTSGSSTCYTSYPYSWNSYFAVPTTKELNLREGHFIVTHYNTSDLIKLAINSTRSALTNMFCRTSDWTLDTCWNRNPQTQPLYNTTNSWVVFTMRPRPGKPITSWDFVNSYASKPNNMISNATLEASVDGVNWMQLDEVTNDVRPTKDTWQSNGTAYDATYATHTGMPIPSGPSAAGAVFAASSVSVAPNAELIAQGGNVSVPKITVSANGMGALTGFALAEDGVIDITDAPAKGAFSVDVDFTGVTLPAHYTFTINGAPTKRNVKLSADGTRIDVVPSGFVILVK